MMKKKQKKIYCDVAASSPILPEAAKAMLTVMKEAWVNPGSIYDLGVQSKNILEQSRLDIANFLGAHAREIIFTSGGTESNNLAILGVYNYFIKAGCKSDDLHFITTNIEHSSILAVYEELKSRGCDISILPVEKDGRLNPKILRAEIKPNTVLISIAHANSEIGVIQNVEELAKEIRHARKTSFWRESEDMFGAPYFHLDASQSVNYLPLDTKSLGVDLITIDGQKVGASRGVGALYIKNGTPIKPIMFGGRQEMALRPGTENVLFAVGLAHALMQVKKIQNKEVKKLSVVRDYFIKKIQKVLSQAIINGSQEYRLPNNVNFSLPSTDAEFILLQLAEKGIYCSAKSACLPSEAGSYVIEAVSDNKATAKSSLRFTFDSSLSKKEVDYIVKVLKEEIIK
ncbi:MAG: cysteine desulfurase family protein [bacterium]